MYKDEYICGAQESTFDLTTRGQTCHTPKVENSAFNRELYYYKTYNFSEKFIIILYYLKATLLISEGTKSPIDDISNVC